MLRHLIALAATASIIVLGACQSSAQTGLVAGAGIGALMGQAIGGNTTGTLIGTAVGSGVGYVIGNERDRQRADELTRQNTAEIARLNAELASRPATPAPPAPPPAPRVDRPTHTEVGALGNTRWMLVSINPRDAAPPHASLLVDFRPNGRVLTTTTRKDGTVETADESYRVVGTTLIVNRPGYLINARWQIAGDQLVITSESFSAVLQRLPS